MSTTALVNFPTFPLLFTKSTKTMISLLIAQHWLVLQGSQKVFEYLNILLIDSDINIVTNYYFNGFHEDEIVSSTLEKGGKTFKYLILYCDISLDIFTYQKTDDGKKR